ncbi:thiol reductant ABC exporter subunit CydC [Anaerolentibacter hominis]|uniref:thiol reductant ABC exporter subunit CydC n=1 Tax=Anaerolentibacter hominis TaxID=3079009 RepID=UPI0031B8B2F0
MKERSGFAVMGRLIGLVKPLSGYMILAVGLGAVGHLFAASITILGGYGILTLLPAQTGSGLPLQWIFLCMGMAALLRGFLRYGEQACNHFIAFKLLALIRSRVFDALRRLCPAKLEGRDRGNLISVITSDIELLEVFYAHTISPAAIAFLMTVIMTFWIGSIHWLLGMTALAAYLTVGILLPLLASGKSRAAGMAFRQLSGDLSSYVLDSLRGIQESIQYGGGKKRLEELNRRTDALSREEEKQKRMTGKNMALTNTVILLFDLLLLGVAAGLYTRGTISFSGLVLSLLSLMSSFGPVIALSGLGNTLSNTLAAGSRVLDILDETPTVQEIEGCEPVVFRDASIDDVTFGYEKKPVLSHINLKIPGKSVIGITGRSGCGKSTLLKLLMRFWDTESGSVELSDTPVGRINTGNLRDMESFVTQETHLFHDSIRNNIRIARPEASEEEIIEACRKAALIDFIEKLPRGLETNAGELGDALSGGERQRIGLARAFLHNAPLILLDEPTSNLDSLNEAVILKALHQERENKTVVLVSHRKSSMRIADRVFSVENGRYAYEEESAGV